MNNLKSWLGIIKLESMPNQIQCNLDLVTLNRECVRNLDLQVQVHPGELALGLKIAGADSTRSLKISGCKR